MRLRIHVRELALGMYVDELDRPWLGTPFLFQGFVLTGTDDLATLQRLCTHVIIDPEKSTTMPARLDTAVQVRAPTRPAPPPAGGAGEGDEFLEALEQAREIHRRAGTLVETMHDDITAGRIIDTQGSEFLVRDMVANVTRNPDALLWMTHLKQRDRYTAQHSLNVSILAITFGHHLGLETEELQELGLGALLHDVGKLKVPLEILNKPGRLSEHELAIMKSHPTAGFRLLDGAHGLNDRVIDVALSHHERIAGHGYPYGRKGSAISRFTRIVSIVDVYDALTSDRAYHDGAPAQRVLRDMYRAMHREFDADLLPRFVDFLGVFPTGTLVELARGDVGVVLPAQDRSRRHRVLLLVLDPEKRRYYPLRILDFGLIPAEHPDYRITAELAPGSYGLNALEIVDELPRARHHEH